MASAYGEYVTEPSAPTASQNPVSQIGEVYGEIYGEEKREFAPRGRAPDRDGGVEEKRSQILGNYYYSEDSSALKSSTPLADQQVQALLRNERTPLAQNNQFQTNQLQQLQRIQQLQQGMAAQPPVQSQLLPRLANAPPLRNPGALMMRMQAQQQQDDDGSYYYSEIGSTLPPAQPPQPRFPGQLPQQQQLQPMQQFQGYPPGYIQGQSQMTPPVYMMPPGDNQGLNAQQQQVNMMYPTPFQQQQNMLYLNQFQQQQFYPRQQQQQFQPRGPTFAPNQNQQMAQNQQQFYSPPPPPQESLPAVEESDSQKNPAIPTPSLQHSVAPSEGAEAPVQPSQQKRVSFQEKQRSSSAKSMGIEKERLNPTDREMSIALSYAPSADLTSVQDEQRAITYFQSTGPRYSEDPSNQRQLLLPGDEHIDYITHESVGVTSTTVGDQSQTGEAITHTGEVVSEKEKQDSKDRRALIRSMYPEDDVRNLDDVNVIPPFIPDKENLDMPPVRSNDYTFGKECPCFYKGGTIGWYNHEESLWAYCSIKDQYPSLRLPRSYTWNTKWLGSYGAYGKADPLSDGHGCFKKRTTVNSNAFASKLNTHSRVRLSRSLSRNSRTIPLRRK